MQKLAIAAAVSISLNGAAFALGLGEIEMYSALNQSLDAEIEILSASEDELRGMQVRLASSDAFERAGLLQLPVLSSVQFTVDQRPDGKPVVKLNSDSPVLEPFLNFLIEVDAPGSVTLVREYTVLLDPPSFGGADAEAQDAIAVAQTDTTGVDNVGSDGLAIDLSSLLDTSASDSASTVSSDDDIASISTGEVSFSETTVSTAVGSEQSSNNNLFIPDAIVIADSAPVGQTADSAIFDAEFGSTEDAELISTEELSGASIGDFSNTTDTDAAGLEVGGLIDLSGLVGEASTDDSDTTFTDNVSTSAQVTEVSGDRYRVQTEDTLWRIANRTRANGVTSHQMMVALLNANPQAFVGGNMNRIVNGAVLDIPTEASQRSVDAAEALSVVRSWTRNNTTSFTPSSNSFTIEPSPEVITPLSEDAYITDGTTTIIIEDNTSDASLAGDLEDVNRRMEIARNELANETLQRDELRGRVNNLEDNMEQVQDLITLRESQLSDLQDEVAVVESEQVDQSSSLTDDMAEAISEVERRADLDKNIATAEAESKMIRLSSEEDTLRSQLAALEIEKRDLVASSQAENAELVRQSEIEKSQLLQQAGSERERIMAELESQKVRITSDADVEIAKIRSGSATDNERAVSEAQANRDRVAAETAEMESKLAAMEAEKARMLEAAEAEKAAREAEAAAAEVAKAEAAAAEMAEAEAADDSSSVMGAVTDMKDGAADKAADMKASMADTDAAGKVDEVTGTGKEMMANGVEKVTGLIGAGPMTKALGDRKVVFGAGAGLALLGLLGAWATRRRKVKPAVDERVLRPRADARRAPPPAQSRTNFDDRKTMYEDEPRNKGRSRAAGVAGAAAATAAAGTAAVAARNSHAEPTAESAATPVQPQVTHEPVQPVTAPAVQGSQPASPVTNEPEINEVELEDVALDDTITEAEVYLRYGLHGQAEDLLKTAIERSPDNEEYHFKLLENYHDQKNAESFNEAASTFNQKFSTSEHQGRVAEMSRNLNANDAPAVDAPAVDSNAGDDKEGGLGGIGAGAAVAAGAVGVGAMTKGKDAIAGVGSMLDGQQGLDTTGDANLGNANLDNSIDGESLLDQTIDPGTEFSVDELQATGDLGAMTDDLGDFGDQGGMSLDDVDLASLDDDGTMNLEEIAGSQMSGSDLGTLDLTNTDTSFDNLSLEDADIGAVSGSLDSFDDDSLDAAGLTAAGAAGSSEEMESMLDLAKAYMDMGDNTNASKALKDIAARGNPLQQTEAAELLKKLS